MNEPIYYNDPKLNENKWKLRALLAEDNLSQLETELAELRQRYNELESKYRKAGLTAT